MNAHALLATLVAAGWTDDAIADVAGLSPQAIRVIRASPLFRAFLDRTRAQLHQATAATAGERFNALLPQAIETYRDALLQRDDLNAALRAADRVTERVLGPTAATTPAVHLHLDPTERALITRVAAEVGAPIEIEASPPVNGHGMRTLDDAIADAEAAT